METNFQFSSAAVSDRGLSEKRPQNEDSFLELKKIGLFAVADGVGGAQAGDVASQMAIEILGEAFINMPPNGDAEDFMKLGIEKANSAIYQMSHDLAQLSTMATTIVALHLQGNIATVGHVGDSRLYRLDKNGNLLRETQDHSMVEAEVRAGRMTPAQAANHPAKNVISRALGADSAVEVDLKTIMFEPVSTFLICSDGITRHLEDFEIREMLASVLEPEEICTRLKNICYQRGAEDNLTAVVIRVSEELINRNESQTISENDFDEPTIAAVRQPNVIDPPSVSNYSSEFTFSEDTETCKLESQKFNEAEKAFVSPDSAEISSVQALPEIKPSAGQSEVNAAAPASAEPVLPVKDEVTYRIEEQSDSGFFSKLLSSLLLLITGAIIGIGVYYFAFASKVQPIAAPPPITQMQTPDIPFSAFEQNRRNVDKNPQQFISANAVQPQDAEDYFLLGRAYLLTGKYPEARNAFIEAKNRLAQSKNSNTRTLTNEIAISMAIINNTFAQQSFEKDLSAFNSQNNSASDSVVTNSTNAANANANSNADSVNSNSNTQ